MSADATTRTTLQVPLGEEQLALHRFGEAGRGEPMLLAHGSIENGRIFYSASGKGLAPLLAREGFSPYVLDFRGRGESTPHVSRRSRWGQWELINEDLPAALEAAERDAGRPVRLAVAHSWGGVLLSSLLARREALREQLRGVAYFGSKRCIHVENPDKFLQIDLAWDGFFVPLAKLFGYLPARKLGFGADDESLRSHAETRAWVTPSAWVDPRDGFDHGAALRGGPPHPRTLHVTGVRDTFLGHPEDVKRFAEETRAPYELRVLSRANGQVKDYGHIDLLTAPEAATDHLPAVIDWLRDAVR